MPCSGGQKFVGLIGLEVSCCNKNLLPLALQANSPPISFIQLKLTGFMNTILNQELISWTICDQIPIDEEIVSDWNTIFFWKGMITCTLRRRTGFQDAHLRHTQCGLVSIFHSDT